MNLSRLEDAIWIVLFKGFRCESEWI